VRTITCGIQPVLSQTAANHCDSSVSVENVILAVQFQQLQRSGQPVSIAILKQNTSSTNCKKLKNTGLFYEKYTG